MYQKTISVYHNGIIYIFQNRRSEKIEIISYLMSKFWGEIRSKILWFENLKLRDQKFRSKIILAKILIKFRCNYKSKTHNQAKIQKSNEQFIRRFVCCKLNHFKTMNNHEKQFQSLKSGFAACSRSSSPFKQWFSHLLVIHWSFIGHLRRHW